MNMLYLMIRFKHLTYGKLNSPYNKRKGNHFFFFSAVLIPKG